MIIVKTNNSIYTDVRAFHAGYSTGIETHDGLYIENTSGWYKVIDCSNEKAKNLLVDIINIIVRSRNMANIIIEVYKGHIVLM